MENISPQKNYKNSASSYGNSIFFIAYIFMFFISFTNEIVLKNYIPSDVWTSLRILTVALVLIKLVFFSRFKYLELFTYVCIGAILMLSILKSREYLLLDLFVTILAAKEVSGRKIIKMTFIVLTLCLISIFLLSLLGLIPNLTYGRVNSDGVQVIRNSFGTTYPTIFGSFIFFWSLQFLYLKNKITYVDSLLFLILSIFIDKFTDNRLIFILLLVISLYCLFYRVTKYDFTQKKKSYAVIWISIMLIVVLGFVLICQQYGKYNSFLQPFDKLLSGRIYLSWKGFITYPNSLFGNVIDINGWGNGNELSYGTSYFYLDSLPVYLLIVSGSIVFIFYLIYNLTFLKKCFTNNNNRLLIIITLIIIYDLVDNKSIRVAFNPFILTYFNTLFGYEEVLESKGTSHEISEKLSL